MDSDTHATIKHTDVCSFKSHISELNVLQSVIQCLTGINVFERLSVLQLIAASVV
jgi:hypothetical protein